MAGCLEYAATAGHETIPVPASGDSYKEIGHSSGRNVSSRWVRERAPRSAIVGGETGSAQSGCIPGGCVSCIPGAGASSPQASGATPQALALPALSRSVKGRQCARRDLRPSIVPQALPWHPGWSVMTSSAGKGRVPGLPEPPSGRVFTPYSGYISQSVEVPTGGSLPGTFQRKGSTTS